MTPKKIYFLLSILLAAIISIYFYNKYKVAPKVNFSTIQLVTETNTDFNYQSLHGKKVIVCFYASWCPNCLEELSNLNAIKNSELQGVEVLAITDEPLEKLTAFKTKKQYPFTFLKLKKTFADIGIFSIPTAYLLNTKSEIVYQTVGYINWQDNSTLNHLKALMN